MKHFFIIYSPQGSSDPKHQHETLQSAEDEAKRLAVKHPSKQFFVMKSWWGFQTPQTVETILLDDVEVSNA